MAATATEIDAYVGQRMRQRRESLGISQGRLGRHLGITFSQVQKYEKGANRIGAGRLFLLANFLGVPIHYFFDGLVETDGLPDQSAGGTGGLAALDDAFLSIPDPETRRSVLALVFSLASARAKGGRGGPPDVPRRRTPNPPPARPDNDGPVTTAARQPTARLVSASDISRNRRMPPLRS